MNEGEAIDQSQVEAAGSEMLAKGLLAQIQLLWDVELGDTRMAVDFDPLSER